MLCTDDIKKILVHIANGSEDSYKFPQKFAVFYINQFNVTLLNKATCASIT